MSVRSQSAFLRKAGTLTVWLIIFCIYFLGVYNYVQIRNDTAVSVFLSAAYPDRKGAENILKQERKSEKPYDVCFYADAGLREISAKEGNRQAQAMTVYLKGNPAGYDWKVAALTEGDPDGCVIDGTTAWELFGNKVPGGQILFQGRIYTVRKVADWGQKILVFGAASADDTETELFYNRLFIRRRNGETEESTVNGFLMKYGLQGTVVSSALPKNAGLAALLLLPAVLSGSLWTEISREKKNYTVKDAEYWFCNLLYSVMAGTVVWLLFTHLTWPEGWIPSRWSDFGFWKEKVDQAVAEFKLYLMLPKTVSQTEGMILGGKTVCAGGGSCFLYLLWKVYEKGYDRISDRGRRGKDFPVEQN